MARAIRDGRSMNGRISHAHARSIRDGVVDKNKTANLYDAEQHRK